MCIKPKLEMIGLLDMKGMDCIRRVYHPAGIAPTLTTCGGGHRQVKIYDTNSHRVRKLTPTEYGRLQAFPMRIWKQVVSDSQAYKQFGNAVTVTLFSAIAKKVKEALGKKDVICNDFFCGAGGMGLAFKNAGFEIAGAWDFDKFAIQTYRENVDRQGTLADIRNMSFSDVPAADVWTFGFPCQDLSVAGKQRGLILKCQSCGEEITVKPEEYDGTLKCHKCGGSEVKAESRSGCFFEMMRLLDETKDNMPDNMPSIIVAENVKGLKPYIPLLKAEYKRRGYEAHVKLFNSMYWGVAQSRERYAVVGVKDGVQFQFPEEQMQFVPPLSMFIDSGVDEKFFMDDEKSEKVLSQALLRLDGLEDIHPCITPDRIEKRQNGRRAKGNEEPMFTLTAQDLHGIIERRVECSEQNCGRKTHM